MVCTNVLVALPQVAQSLLNIFKSFLRDTANYEQNHAKKNNIPLQITVSLSVSVSKWPKGKDMEVVRSRPRNPAASGSSVSSFSSR